MLARSFIGFVDLDSCAASTSVFRGARLVHWWRFGRAEMSVTIPVVCKGLLRVAL